METAKSKDRPKLKNWARDGFAFHRKDDFQVMKYLSPSHDLAESKGISTQRSPHTITTVDKVSCHHLTLEEFVGKYEKPEIPCIIESIPTKECWTAVEKWNFKSFRRFKDRLFKVGEDDDGYKVKVKMKYFLKYLQENKDDSPLYVFDGSYDMDGVSKALLDEYHVPSYFPDDLFYLVGEKRRPPYRWFLVGPERSGTCVHIDPLGTSAWNTLLQGKKRWVIFPPGTAKNIAKGTDVIKKGEDDEAINYFVDLLPRIKDKYGAEVHVIEFMQLPGDTVFVPGGWWHAVLNVEDSIAITQVSPTPVPSPSPCSPLIPSLSILSPSIPPPDFPITPLACLALYRPAPLAEKYITHSPISFL